MSDGLLIGSLFILGLVTIVCAIGAVYAVPMGLILKERKMTMLGLKCLAGAIVGAFIIILFLACTIKGKGC